MAQISGWRRYCAVLALVAVAVGVSGIAAAGAGGSSGTAVVPVSPVRILDTRNGTGGASTPIGPDALRRLTLAGVAGVPADATGVLLNVTAVNGTTASFLTVYPDGLPRPETSNLNWSDAAAQPNLVAVAIGANGAIDIYNNAGEVDIVVDLAGYFTAAPTPTTPPPARGLAVLSAESIVEPGHDWSAGPFPFNTAGVSIGTDISHDAAGAPESFLINRAGVYRVDYHVADEGCCAWDGTLAITLDGVAINPISAIGDGGHGGGGGISHTVIADVANAGTTMQLLLSTGAFLEAPYSPYPQNSFASITIERIGDHT